MKTSEEIISMIDVQDIPATKAALRQMMDSHFLQNATNAIDDVNIAYGAFVRINYLLEAIEQHNARALKVA